MNYEKAWNRLKNILGSKLEYYKNGTMCSIDESVHGENICRELYSQMNNLEIELKREA